MGEGGDMDEGGDMGEVLALRMSPVVCPSRLSLERVSELETDPLFPYLVSRISTYLYNLPRVRTTLSRTDYTTHYTTNRLHPFLVPHTGGKKERPTNEETADVADQQAPVIIRGCGQDGAEGGSTMDKGENHCGREKH